MKKMSLTLICLLVLCLACTVEATITMELREDDGVTPASYLLLGSDYVLVISGASADAGAELGLYGPTYSAADWAALGPPDSTVAVLDTGNISYIMWNAPYQGYEAVADDIMGDGVSTGDWFTIDLTSFTGGAVGLYLYDYRVSSTTPIASIEFGFPPPPPCFPRGHPDYYQWVSVGAPSSWCYPRQCHGDADGQKEPIGKAWYWVGFDDLDIFLEGFGELEYIDPETDPWICADFDHQKEQMGKAWYRVGYNDLDIFIQYFGNLTVETDCLDVP